MTITDNEGKEMQVTDLHGAIAQAIQYAEYDDGTPYGQSQKEYWADVLNKLRQLKNPDTPANGSIFFNEYGEQCIVVSQDTLGRNLVYCQRCNEPKTLTQEEVHGNFENDRYMPNIFVLWDFDYNQITFLK